MEGRRAWMWEQWAELTALVSVPPVRPPTPVLIETPPSGSVGAAFAAASAVASEAGVDRDAVIDNGDGRWVDVSTGELLPQAGGMHAIDGDAQDQEIDQSEADAGGGAGWPGPAVLVMGPVLAVGWASLPERRAVVELAAYLVLHSDRARTGDEVRVALWPLVEGREEVKADTLRQHVSRLRRCLGDGYLPDVRDAGGYRVAATVTSDWHRFQALTEASRRAAPSGAIKLLREAMGLVRGAPFAGVERGSYGWVWDELLVSEMEARIVDAAHRLAGLAMAHGAPGVAGWAVGRGLLALPADEVLWGDRLAAAAMTGGRSGLARCWRDAREVLGGQADDGPLARTYHALLAGLS